MKKVYLVGGAVRDELLGRPTNDLDYVAVGCTFEQLQASFGDPVGADFPVFIDPADGSQIAMARRERKTGVGYHGFSCDFGTDVTLEEDLSRRDLTINALAKDSVHGNIIDYFGGLDDLKNKVLRHVSPAFAEDPLRVVRLARFAARYEDFSIAEETQKLAISVVESGELDHIPYERYWLEISKAVEDGRANLMFHVLHSFGVFNRVKFFKEVWGNQHEAVRVISKMDKLARTLRYVRDEIQFAYFVALTAKNDLPGRVHALPTHVTQIHQAVQRIDRMGDLEVEAIFELFKTTKAWQDDTLIKDVILAVEVLNNSGHVTAVWPDELKEMLQEVRRVTSEPYTHLEGPAIGVAMNKERKARIKRLIAVF
jgi:tRNA nucleotidyltransferase/poly(A) polymerase